MILSSDDVLYAYKKIKDTYQSIGRIDDYFRMVKYDKVNELTTPLFGMSMEDDMFQSYDMHPEDMNFRVDKPNNSSTFDDMLEMTSSFSVVSSPGKEMKLLVKETNTNTAVGFIRLASPLINSKPRNNWLGSAPDLSIFNKRAIMGFTIVPIQPFGFNYLGGKLLSLICCSHEVREMLNKKYDTEMCLFETTSLYGNIKGTSQYDGLKPFLRYRGDTTSKFLLTLPDFVYHDLLKWFIEKNNGEELIRPDASSRKLKTQTKIISIIKNSLKEHHPELHTEFIQFIKSREDITTQKRFYMSDYGYANAREVLLGQTETLIPNKENFDKFYLENMIEWWKRKASSRYNRLKEEGSVRTKLEVWNTETINDIDIIR